MDETLTDTELARQIAAGTARAEEEDRMEPRAVSARYDATTGRIVVDLRNGCLFAFPAELVQGLRGAPVNQLAEVEVDPHGLSLHWEALDVDLSVTGLVSGVFGGKGWMRELTREMGRKGGAASGGAKADAARANGKKGGRPRKTAVAEVAQKDAG